MHKPRFRPFTRSLFVCSALLLLPACQKQESQSSTADATEPAAAPAPATSSDDSSTLTRSDRDQPSVTAPNLSLETTAQKVSYGIGRNIGADLARNNSFETDVEAMVAGLHDSMTGAESRVPAAELQAAFSAIRAEAQAAAQAEVAAVKAEGEKFLAVNAQRPEVTTTASGLQYEVLVEGTGPKPTADQTVEVHYHGTLLDGTVFDSSVQRGETIEFPVTGVIKGWIEALQLMPTGSKWKLFIPANLAYGDRATGKIPAGSTLVFEVELISIK